MNYIIESKDFIAPNGTVMKANFRLGTNDRDTLTACIENDDYHFNDFLDPEQDAVAIDLGCHVAGATLALAALGYKIHAVEILPENQEMILMNLASSGMLGLVTLYPYAISDKDSDKIMVGYGDLNTVSGRMHHFMGNTNCSKDDHNLLQLEVETISLNTILDSLESCHIIKSDCEGGEWKAFSNLTDENLDKITWISAELHGDTTERFMGMLRGKFIDVSEEYGMPFGHNLFRKK